MAYGQINYKDVLGVNIGRNYTIASAGCFVVAFCNLLQRFGVAVDPPTLNKFFIDHGVYVDAPPRDGILDDVDWSFVCRYTSKASVTAIANGRPTSNNSIVKFSYQSKSKPTINGKPNIVTHFSLVADAAAGTIIDSWDGQIRSWDVYGGPIAYCTYGFATETAAQVDPVQAAAPAPAPAANRYEPIAPISFVLNKDPTNVWDLGFTQWPEAHVVEQRPHESKFVAVGIYHHPLKADYYMDAESFGDAANTGRASSNRGVNHADLSIPAAPAPAPAPVPVPAPAPTPPAPNFTIEKLDAPVVYRPLRAVAPLWNFDTDSWVTINQNQFGSIPNGQDVVVVAIAHNTTLPPNGADYYMTSDDYDAAAGVVLHTYGINHADLELKPADVAPAAQAPAPATVITPDNAPAPDPVVSDETKAIGWFRVIETTEVRDFKTGQPTQTLYKGQLVHRATTFSFGPDKFGRTDKSVESGFYYGIPNGLLVPTQAPTKAQVATVDDDEDDSKLDELIRSIHVGQNRVDVEIDKKRDDVIKNYSQLSKFIHNLNLVSWLKNKKKR